MNKYQYEIDKLLHQYKYGVITLKTLIFLMLPYCDYELQMVCDYLAIVLSSWDTRDDFLPWNITAEDLLFFWENN